MPLRLYVGYEMNREDIIQMAREAQMPFYWRTGEITYLDKLERFAALVAETEREVCAKVLDEMAEDMVREMEPSTAIYFVRSKAASIRARGAVELRGETK